MSKCTEIRDICGDYAFDVEYAEGNKFTMFFNSRRNAQTVKRCIEVDDSVPNVATAVDFVEVVRCKNCKYSRQLNKTNVPEKYFKDDCVVCECEDAIGDESMIYPPNHFCSYGERRI